MTPKDQNLWGPKLKIKPMKKEDMANAENKTARSTLEILWGHPFYPTLKMHSATCVSIHQNNQSLTNAKSPGKKNGKTTGKGKQTDKGSENGPEQGVRGLGDPKNLHGNRTLSKNNVRSPCRK